MVTDKYDNQRNGTNFQIKNRSSAEHSRQTDRQTDILLTERKSLQTYLS